ARSDDSAGMDASGRKGRLQQLGGARKPKARLGRLDDALFIWVAGDQFGTEDDHSGVAVERLLSGGCVFSKDDVSGRGEQGGVDAANAVVGASLDEHAALTFNEFADFHGVPCRMKKIVIQVSIMERAG